MKYLVTVEEWEQQQKVYRNLGIRDGLMFIEYTLCQACWNEKKEMEQSINEFLHKENPQNNNDSFVDKRANPMLSIIGHIRAFEQMVRYLREINPNKLKEVYNPQPKAEGYPEQGEGKE